MVFSFQLMMIHDKDKMEYKNVENKKMKVRSTWNWRNYLSETLSLHFIRSEVWNKKTVKAKVQRKEWFFHFISWVFYFIPF